MVNLAVRRPKNKKDSCLRDINLHDNLERKTRRALQGECMAQRKISEAEMERR